MKKIFITPFLLLMLLLWLIYPSTAWAETAGYWDVKGKASLRSGEYQDALECFNQALALDSELADAWDGKGFTLFCLGRTEEALACYDRALDLNPSNPEVWRRKGTALIVLSRDREALECYDQALVLNPAKADAWVDKGWGLNLMGRYKEALECYHKALTLKPQSAYALEGQGDTLAAQGRYREAIASYNQALNFNSKDAYARRHRNTALRKLCLEGSLGNEKLLLWVAILALLLSIWAHCNYFKGKSTLAFPRGTLLFSVLLLCGYLFMEATTNNNLLALMIAGAISLYAALPGPRRPKPELVRTDKIKADTRASLWTLDPAGRYPILLPLHKNFGPRAFRDLQRAKGVLLRKRKRKYIGVRSQL